MRDYVVNNKNVKANIRFSEIFKRIDKAKEELQSEIDTDMAIYDKENGKLKFAHPEDYYETVLDTYKDKWLQSFQKSVGDFK